MMYTHLSNGLMHVVVEGYDKYSKEETIRFVSRVVKASLSLLRQPVEQCRQMLFAFMVQAQKEWLRNVLIVHGKGRDDQSHANIIRSYLARWLEELPEVQAFCAALPHHGGSGACYVALRKSSQAKQETWEQHAKRSR